MSAALSANRFVKEDSFNNFDTLRIFAALLVFFSHSFPLTYGSDAAEPLFRLTHGRSTIGHLGLILFFVVSGYLVTRSFLRSGSSVRFLLARGLRLLPGLAVALILTAGLLGAAVSTEPLPSYFASGKLWLFFGRNLSLLPRYDALPGVFTANPFPHAVAGSLWTLHYEAACYFGVLLLGVTRLLNKWAVGCLMVAAMIGAALAKGGSYAGLGAFFLGGGVILLFEVPLRGWVAGLSAGLFAGSLGLGGTAVVLPVTGAYVVLYLALSPAVRLPRLARWGDLSYGIYNLCLAGAAARDDAAGPASELVAYDRAVAAGRSWTGLAVVASGREAGADAEDCRARQGTA